MMTPGVLVCHTVRFLQYMVEDTITIGIRWVRLAVQSCRPTVSEEASTVAEELYGGSVMPDASNLDPRVYSIHIGTRLLAVVNAFDHLDGFSQSSRVDMRNLHCSPGTRIQAKCSTHLHGRLVDYGKDEVAGKSTASLSEEAWVLGRRQSKPSS